VSSEPASGIAKPAGFVLCGGKSSRMGQNKALLDLGGVPLVVRVANRLKPFCSEVYLVAGSPEPYHSFGFPILVDEYPGEGPLGALVTILDLAAAEWNVVLSCDLAAAEPGPIEALIQDALEDGGRAVIPQSATGPEPLHAVYRLDLLEDLHRLWDGGERGMIRALSGLAGVRIVPAADLDAGPAQFLNVNTFEEWLAFRGGERV